jgi:adenine-specific DNA-methyltransferase
MIENSKRISLKYCLGVINSKTINFYFKQILSSNLHVYPEAIRNLPIKTASEVQQQPIINCVDKIQSLKKRVVDIQDKQTDARAKLEAEIKKTDAEIDDLVYKIYGITDKERKIIEESLK